MIRITDAAFADLVTEIDYPMNEWGRRAMEDYACFTLTVLDILNSINSSLSHFSHARVSILHSLSLNRKSLDRIYPLGKNTCAGNEFGSSPRTICRPICPKETVLVRAMAVSRDVHLLALGFMLSCLCGETKAYVEIRKSVEVEDSVVGGLDSRLYGAGMMEEVREVNVAVDRMMSGAARAEEVVARLKILESSIRETEKEADAMFYRVLGRRNKMLTSVDLHRRSGA